MDRNKSLITLRPVIESIKTHNRMSPEETFQNDVLRPIIKFQHELIMNIVETSLYKYHKEFSKLLPEKKKLIIESLFNSNNQLKNELRNIIVGLFIIEEYQTYKLIRSDINKRIIQIIQERVLSTL